MKVLPSLFIYFVTVAQSKTMFARERAFGILKKNLSAVFNLILYFPEQYFSYVEKGLPGFNQYLAGINVSC